MGKFLRILLKVSIESGIEYSSLNGHTFNFVIFGKFCQFDGS